jgi:glycosyltransferase involved in cell wall biosynthesis
VVNEKSTYLIQKEGKMSKPARIGFISTRFSGTDGVSLEAAKWVQVIESQGHTCTFFASASVWPSDVSYVVQDAHFEHPEVRQLSDDHFDDFLRSPQTTRKVNRMRRYLKSHLDRFVNQNDIQILIVENALAIPMHVPLALAITELVAERGLPTIAHHHDFTWEGSRYAVSAADDYLRAAFPPLLHSVLHVVINSYARQQLALRTGASATVIPNVMDFASPPPAADVVSQTLRRSLAISAENYLLLQPSRIVPRKRIELAIELARRLDLPCTLLITHGAGEEGNAYDEYLRQYAALLRVDVRFAGSKFAPPEGNYLPRRANIFAG